MSASIDVCASDGAIHTAFGMNGLALALGSHQLLEAHAPLASSVMKKPSSHRARMKQRLNLVAVLHRLQTMGHSLDAPALGVQQPRDDACINPAEAIASNSRKLAAPPVPPAAALHQNTQHHMFGTTVWHTAQSAIPTAAGAACTRPNAATGPIPGSLTPPP